MTANPAPENQSAAASTPDVRGSGLSVASGSRFSDTDRLNFLLRHFRVDDCGDEDFCPGIVISSEALEDDLFKGFCDGVDRDAITCLQDDVRNVIDRAMAHCANSNSANPLLAE